MDQVLLDAVFQCGNCDKTAPGKVGFSGNARFGPAEIPAGWMAKTIGVTIGVPMLRVRCPECLKTYVPEAP